VEPVAPPALPSGLEGQEGSPPIEAAVELIQPVSAFPAPAFLSPVNNDRPSEAKMHVSGRCKGVDLLLHLKVGSKKV